MSIGTSLISLLAPAANTLIPDITAFLLHSTVLVAGALLAVRLLERRGMAAQSLVLKTFLFLVLICPVLMYLLRDVGVGIVSLPVPVEETRIDVSVGPVPENLRAIFLDPLALDTSSDGPMIVRSPVPIQAVAGDPGIHDQVPSYTATSGHDTPGDAGQQGRDGPGWRTYAYVTVFIVWSATSLFFAVRLLYGFMVILFIRMTARTAGLDAYREGARLANRHRVPCPRLLKSRFVRTPFLAGIFAPVIILPEHGRVSGEIIAHELAHFIRGDCFWKLIGQLVHVIIPLQPLVALLNRRLEDISDYLCDDFVVENRFDPKTYAFALVRYAEYAASLNRNINPVVQLMSSRSGLRCRVERILSTSIRRRLDTGRTAMFAVSAAGLALTATIAAVTFEATAINLPATAIQMTELVRLPVVLEPSEMHTSPELAVIDESGGSSGQPREDAAVTVAETAGEELTMVAESESSTTVAAISPLATERSDTVEKMETARDKEDDIIGQPMLDDTGLLAILSFPEEDTGNEYHEEVTPDPVQVEAESPARPETGTSDDGIVLAMNTAPQTAAFGMLPDDPPIDLEEFKSYRACIEAGLAMFDDGRFFNALRLFKRAAGFRPGDPEANFHIGNTYLKTADLQKARMFLGMAVAQKPDFDEAHLRLGDTIRNMGDLDGAWEEYKIAYDLNPALMKEKKNIF